MTGKNGIIRRSFYKVELRLESPLNVGNGEDIITDADLLKRDMAGKTEYFIPGTSVAGAFRSYLFSGDFSDTERKAEKKTSCVYGYSDGEKGQMSSVFLSDIVLSGNDGKPVTGSVRDFAGLRHAEETGTDPLYDKQVEDGKKFDMEILEPGLTGSLYIETVVRENDRNDSKGDPDDVVASALQALNIGEIRLGAKKTRGFGRFSITGILLKSFKKENGSKALQSYLEFLRESDQERYADMQSFDSWLKDRGIPAAGGISVQVTIPLRQAGPISIRKYSTRAGDPDFAQITSNGQPVIPASSWAGAIRADGCRILEALGVAKNRRERMMEQWFGCVKSSAEFSHASRIVIDESILKGGNFLTATRNKIDRFTGGTVGTALYTEKTYVHGSTDLVFCVRKDSASEQNLDFPYKALLGLMKLITDDIEDGYLAIGGETAIGHGIFKADSSRSDNWNDTDKDECLAELYSICAQDGEEEAQKG